MIRLVIPGAVPSINNLYIDIGRRGRTLSADGRRYKAESRDYLAKHHHRELRAIVPNRPYALVAVFYLDELEYATFGKPAGAKSRYKKQDVTNCIKIVEDILAEVTAVDDSGNIEVLVCKRQRPAKMPEQTILCIWDKEAEGGPFDDLLRSL